MNTIFVVLCHYEGCDECSAGAHILGVYQSEEMAQAAQRRHDANWEKEHLHYAWSEVFSMVVKEAA